MKRSCFCLRERWSLKRKVTVLVHCSQNESLVFGTKIQLLVAVYVVHSNLDFFLVKTYCTLLFHACSGPNALRINQPMTKTSNKHATFVSARYSILYILLILFATADDNSACMVRSFDKARGFFRQIWPVCYFLPLHSVPKTFSFRYLFSPEFCSAFLLISFVFKAFDIDILSCSTSELNL